MAKKWTNFLIALSADAKTRDKYRDSSKKAQLFQQYDITDPSLLEPGREQDLEDAVAAEGGLKQVEWWIRSAGVEANSEYDPIE